MEPYHKIQTVYLRDPETNYKTLLIGKYALSEFEYLKDNQWMFTEKVNGTNIRVEWTPGLGVRFGGRTANASTPSFLLAKLQDLFPSKLFEDNFPTDELTSVCLYGEGFGAKIQKGGGNYISNGVNFVLFDIRIGAWWLKREDVRNIAYKLQIECVPLIGTGTLNDMVAFVSSGFNSHWGEFMAEGVVARPRVEMFTRNGKRIITKLKCKDFA